MKGILESMQRLAWNQVFHLVTEDDIDDIKNAIEELSNVEQSLDDSEFDTTASHISRSGSGDINDTHGDFIRGDQNNYNMDNNSGQVYFGREPHRGTN